MAVKIDLRVYDTVAHLLLEGRVDSATALQLEKWLERAEADRKKIVVDCSELDFISEAGWKILVKFALVCRKQRGDLVLCGLSGKPRRGLELTGRLGAVLENFDTAAEAVGRI